MGNESKLRICKYINCRHKAKINIESEPFQTDRFGYYHEDCFQEKRDLQLFRDQWKRYISNTVVISQLNKVLNDLLNLGTTSDYLLFVLDWVIKKNKNLRYPNGFRYYVDWPEIKDEYKRSKCPRIGHDAFTAKDATNNAPIFSIRNKEQGFQSVLKKG